MRERSTMPEMVLIATQCLVLRYAVAVTGSDVSGPTDLLRSICRLSFRVLQRRVWIFSEVTTVIVQSFALSGDNLPSAGLVSVCCAQQYDQIYSFDNF